MQTQKVKIEKVVYGGYGMGYLNGRAVFVPYGVPEDLLSVKNISDNRGSQWARIDQILEPSPYRAEPFCACFYKCGGCLWQNIKYEKQAEYKSAVVEDCLRRIGGMDNIKILPAIASGINQGYRSRVRLHWDSAKAGLGFYEAQTNKIVPVKNCPILPDAINAAIERLTAYLEKNPLADLDQAQFMMGSDNEVVLNFMMKSKNKIKEIEGFKKSLPIKGAGESAGFAYRKLWGEDRVYFSINNEKIQACANTFFQANTSLVPEMINQIIKYLNKKKINSAVELYSGVGLFSAILSGKVKTLHAIEINPQAVDDLRINLGASENTSVYQMDSEDGLKLLLSKGIKPDLIVTDPPREGMTRAVCSIIKKFSPRQIIYISCNPATLARDLRELSPSYAAAEIQPLDLFPHTPHVESICNIIKK